MATPSNIEYMAIGVSIFGLLVSTVSILLAKKANSKANSIASDNLNLQHSIVELELDRSIEDASARVNETAQLMTPLRAKEKTSKLSDTEKEMLSMYNKTFDASIQSMINAYDSACTKYIDKKIDRVRFKKSYQQSIRNLLGSDDLKRYFDPTTSKYKPILRVYDEWENPER